LCVLLVLVGVLFLENREENFNQKTTNFERQTY
jgi:hypothetical protein